MNLFVVNVVVHVDVHVITRRRPQLPLMSCVQLLVLLFALVYAKPLLIIDTDFATDCDDAGALAVALQLQKVNETRVLGVVHNTGSPWSVPAINAVLTYYGVGAPQTALGSCDCMLLAHDEGPYCRALANGWPTTYPSQTALEVYEQILTNATEKVTIVSIGFFSNIVRLVTSSKLRRLIVAKVDRLVVMGGAYPNSTSEADLHGQGEFNFAFNGTGEMTAKSLALWPQKVPIAFLGFEVGVAILTGGGLRALPATNPVREAYNLTTEYTDPVSHNHGSWDLATVLFAVRGDSSLWREQTTGFNFVTADGNNQWDFNNQDRHQSYLLNATAFATIADEIESLLVAAPMKHRLRK